jgi:hypothetical protein
VSETEGETQRERERERERERVSLGGDAADVAGADDADDLAVDVEALPRTAETLCHERHA